MSIRAVYDCMLFFMRAAHPERSRETFELVERQEVTYCLSAEVIDEIRDVLTRPRHREQFPHLTPRVVDDFLSEIARRCHFCSDVPTLYTLDRDPKDSKYINLALACNAPYLVTRDKDLLSLMDRTSPEGLEFKSRFPTLAILEPAEFVQQVHRPGAGA